MPHWGRSCLVRNFPIDSFNQHLLPELGVAERWRHDVHSIPAATRGLEWGLLQGRQVKGLKWYTYHCRPSVAMIVDLFVLPGLCFQSLSTFYCRFYCRPYKPLWFISVTSTRKMSPLCVEDKQTRMEDEMNCRTKVHWCGHAQWRLQNLQHFDFRPSSTKQCFKNTVRPTLFCFPIRIHPCLIFWQHTCTTILD